MRPIPALAASGRCSRPGHGTSRSRLLHLSPPSQDRSPSGTPCSALRRLVQLLRPLLSPAAPSRRLATPVAHLKPGAGRQASQGKTRDLHAIYLSHLRPHPPGDIGLRVTLPPRPGADASHALAVRQAGTLLTASFRPRLATTPLCFANPSPPSGWVEDFHLQAVEHARHTDRIDGLLAIDGRISGETSMTSGRAPARPSPGTPWNRSASSTTSNGRSTASRSNAVSLPASSRAARVSWRSEPGASSS